MNRSVTRRWLLLGGRLLLCVGLLGYLAHRLETPVFLQAWSRVSDHWPWFAAGLGFTFLGLLAGIVRWRDILGTQGIHPAFREVFGIFFIGQFFNAFMLGACGGDVARAYYVARRTTGRRTEAASTVLVDRGLGLWITVLFSCVMIWFYRPLFFGHAANRGPAMLMLALLAGSGLAMAVLFRRNLFEHWALFRRLEERFHVGRLLRRAYEAFFLYRRHPAVLSRAVLLSLLNLALLTLACLAFARSLEVRQPAHVFFALFPVITVIAAVPLTPGSLGVREGLFVAMFQTVGVGDERAISLSLMVYAGSLFWSLFGGAIFLGYAVGAGHGFRQELEAIQHEATPDVEGGAP